jgi:hypothetical protein
MLEKIKPFISRKKKVKPFVRKENFDLTRLTYREQFEQLRAIVRA